MKFVSPAEGLLITRDRQQLGRLRDLLPVLTPEAWLDR
jgi:hypothetical protein